MCLLGHFSSSCLWVHFSLFGHRNALELFESEAFGVLLSCREKNSSSVSWTKIEGEGRRRRSWSVYVCVCVHVCVCVNVCGCVCVCSLQLWNVESARRAQWHVWNQSAKEGSGTWRVRKKTEKRKTRRRKKRRKKGGVWGGVWDVGREERREGGGVQGVQWFVLGLPRPLLVVNCTGFVFKSSRCELWRDDVKVQRPSVCSHNEVVFMMQAGSRPREDYLKHLVNFSESFCVIFIWNK